MNEIAKELAQGLLHPGADIDQRVEDNIKEHRKGFGSVVIKNADGTPVDQAEVRLQMTKHEFHFGCNSFMLQQFKEAEKNEAYEQRFASLFNLAVVPFYWSDLEPQDGKPRFSKDSPNIYRRPAPDLVLEFCQKNGITPKGHPLCWHAFQPDWLTHDPIVKRARLEQRIQEIADRYRTRIPIWDVCNEALAWNALKPDMMMPNGYTEFAFEVASRCFPRSTVLTYNDFICWDDLHGDYMPFYMLGRHLKNLNVNLGGLGLQYHMFGRAIEKMREWIPTRLNARHLLGCLDQYAKLGLPMNISELTITAHPDLGDGLTFQREVVEKLYRLWFSHPLTNGIIWWNLVDGTGYVNPTSGWDENVYKGGLLNNDLSPKPAYTVLESLIKKEWTTNMTLGYKSHESNRFHGFYGNYDVTIQTRSGIYRRTLKLSRDSLNHFEFVLKNKESLS